MVNEVLEYKCGDKGVRNVGGNKKILRYSRGLE